MLILRSLNLCRLTKNKRIEIKRRELRARSRIKGLDSSICKSINSSSYAIEKKNNHLRIKTIPRFL